MRPTLALLLFLAAITASAAPAPVAAPAAPERFALKSGDVVAMIGGELTVIEGETAHVESLLRIAFPRPGIRFRNLGWEGDTVFDRPRDVNFPSLQDRVKSSGATVVICQFGQAEALAGGAAGVDAFAKAYEALADDLLKQATRLVLVTPPAFQESSDPLLPDLSARNADLKRYADATRQLAARRGWACVDVFTSTAAASPVNPVTDNGLRPTPDGGAWAAMHFVAIAGGEDDPAFDGARNATYDPAGRWDAPEAEALRQAVIAKNKLWFGYTRPMNWAFLGGDRMQVPSSRDHRDPKVRWFPAEMEKYVPLIEEADRKVDEAAKKASETLKGK